MEKTGSKITALDENNITYEFNLLKILTEYEKLATELLVKLINHSIIILVHKKEQKLEIKKRLDTMLPNLIDYSQMNLNKEYKIRQRKKIEKIANKFHGNLTADEVTKYLMNSLTEGDKIENP